MISDSLKFNHFGKYILLTGANSGIGFYSSINLLKNGNYLYIPIRSKKRAEVFINKLKKYFDLNHLNKYLNIIDNVDFSNLDNIKKCKDFFDKKEIEFDIIILNAGIQYTGALYPKVSKQGIELTFAINHLAHFYLTNLFFPLIKDSFNSRIIITSSDVHNPKSSGGNIGEKAGLNNLENFKEEIMNKYKNFNADRSYKNSKLCNILFAKQLAMRLKIRKSRISVITWAPGLVIPEGDLGFFRYSCQYNKLGYFVFSNVAKNILGISETVEDAGKILFEIAMNEEFNKVQYLHLSNKLISYKKHKLIITNVSDEAKDPKLAAKLWEFSKDLCLCFGMTPINL